MKPWAGLKEASVKLISKDTAKDLRTKCCSQVSHWVAQKLKCNLIMGIDKKIGPRNTTVPEQRTRKGIA